MAARMMQAPNTYPQWIAPDAPVQLILPIAFQTNFATHWLEISNPPARLRYSVIDPAQYQLSVTRTNWTKNDREFFRFYFDAQLPAPTNQWTAQPRGTVFLLHGYSIGMFAMTPWALALAEHGWRCVVVDLRGHGGSTGDKIYYGIQETEDMRRLFDTLEARGEIIPPVTVVGESYGAALALRWSTQDSRIQRIAAITPYATLSNSVLNISHEYSGWLPDWWLRAGLRELPKRLGVAETELNPRDMMQRSVPDTLFIAAKDDKIAPPDAVWELYQLAPEERKFLIIANATHEAVPYFFEVLEAPIAEWLNATSTTSPAGN